MSALAPSLSASVQAGFAYVQFAVAQPLVPRQFHILVVPHSIVPLSLFAEPTSQDQGVELQTPSLGQG